MLKYATLVIGIPMVGVVFAGVLPWLLGVALPPVSLETILVFGHGLVLGAVATVGLSRMSNDDE